LRVQGVPVAIAMAGGYAERIEDVVDIHFNTVSLALERWAGEAMVAMLDFAGHDRTAPPVA
jgi:hypothetical protein